MIYIPSPPVIDNGKTIFDFPELIEFIKQGKVIIDKKGDNNCVKKRKRYSGLN